MIIDVKCPRCKSEAVNMSGESIAANTPGENNWYGQQHSVSLPMKCSCGQCFRIDIVSYKDRSTLIICETGAE
jgi:ribosomal protein S27E